MTRPYCPGCLDVHATPVPVADPWKNIRSGVSMHVRCGRALEAIRATPATFEFEPVQRVRWAA